MEIILIALFTVAVLLNFLRLSLINKRGFVIAYVILLSIFLYLIYPWLIEQNKKYIETLLGQSTLMNNLVLLVILEAVVVIGSIFALLKEHYLEKQKKVYLLLRYFPSLTPFLAIGYCQLQAYYFVFDYSFEQITWGVIIMSIVLTILLVKFLQWLINEWEIRLELTFILALVQIFIGIVIGSYYNNISSTSIMTDNLWQPFLAITGAALLITLFGVIYARIKLKKSLKI